MASLFLFRHRCIVARSVSLPTPSPYSLQGMSEKIHFQRFVRQHPLQLGDLPTQDQLAGSRIGRVYFFESIAPVVKQSSRYPQLSRKPEYVVAGLHLLECLASKLVTVSLPFLSLHFAAPFSQSVHHKLSHPRGSLQMSVPYATSTARPFWAVRIGAAGTTTSTNPVAMS